MRAAKRTLEEKLALVLIALSVAVGLAATKNIFSTWHLNHYGEVQTAHTSIQRTGRSGHCFRDFSFTSDSGVTIRRNCLNGFGYRFLADLIYFTKHPLSDSRSGGTYAIDVIFYSDTPEDFQPVMLFWFWPVTTFLGALMTGALGCAALKKFPPARKVLFKLRPVYGKLFGAFSGGIVFGFWGAAMGAALGYIIDQDLAEGADLWGGLDPNEEMLRRSRGDERTFVVIISLMAKLAKLAGMGQPPGSVDIDQLFDRLGIIPSQRDWARSVFNNALVASSSAADFARECNNLFRGRQAQLWEIFEMLRSIAFSDGVLEEAEDEFLQMVAQIFEVPWRSRMRTSQEKRSDRNSNWDTHDTTDLPLESAYRTLGCTPNCSVGEAKKRYRQLAKQYHPDSAAYRSAEPQFKKKMEERFLEIQAAFERISGG